MPTAAKLAAAILFGVLTWYVSDLVTLLFPDRADFGRFTQYNAALGAVVGWVVAGGRARTTWPNAVAYGMTAALCIMLLALLINSLAVMLSQSFRRVYEGPVEALADVARLMVEKFVLIATPQIMVTLLVGGVLAGLATEWVARKYK
jgi:hypothetical protein